MKNQKTAVALTYNPLLDEVTPVIPAHNTPNNETSVNNEHRVFYLAVIALLFSFASFAISGFKINSSFHAQMVVVDINHLLRQKATDIVKQQTNNQSEMSRDVALAEQAKRIRAVIEEYAHKNKVIVAVKGSILSGDLKEVTDEISALI